ncbi:MAG: hypothetical protein ACFB6R_03705 [Alphaproteobacteria bacterium]
MSVSDQTQEADGQTAAQTIIAIHGVGSPEPMQLVTEVTDALAVDHDFERQGDRIEAGGQGHGRLRLIGHPTVRDVIEVNWADIEAPPRGPFSLMLFLFRLLIGLIQMGASGWRGARPGVLAPSLFASLFGHYMVFVGIWTIGLPLMSLHMLVAEATWGRIVALVFITALTLITTLATARYDRRFLIGYGWTLVNLTAGLYLITYPEYAALFTANAAILIDLLQVVGFGLPLLAFFELLVRMVILAPSGKDGEAGRRDTILPFLVRFACMLLPLFVIAGLIALIFLMHILPYSFAEQTRQLLDVWLALFRYSGLETQAIHQAVLWTIGGLGAFGLLAVLIPFLLSLRSRAETPPASGRVFQNRMAWVLFLLPLLFLPLGISALVDMLKLGIPPIVMDPVDLAMPQMAMTEEEAVLGRSALGVLVLLGFVGLLLGPGRTMVDVAGDVVFYILPPEYEQNAVATALRQRVEALLDRLAETGDHGPLVLVGYSQGSVIAADSVRALDAGLRGRLVTLGSPICSLYERFLEIPTAFEGQPPTRWDNLYRPTDFVGGPVGSKQTRGIGLADADTPVLGNRKRHHMNYWPEPEVRAVLTGTGTGTGNAGA